jgi:hypothetical protein
MATIHHLEVQITADAIDDETTFARMFKRYIERWSRAEQEAKARDRLAESERSLRGEEG